ncbi:hypothetical protein CONCODRAFT_9846 [Conidiobolus coronatus NRRL 28638]|uniref:Uncharacterized protein n=1 Tax=Conidiobolus coronatus (strain ATCC 28846 / CBS 209.66 / NRRL 28638) TaxID=796925 RepID=A0A137NZI4_CONC2|nr:hypothetical protein CONCODRAFT_9846 [Conidiobolus coronatus NRRL 28638]|eukprot:KXN67989.1 hypothetical protein CONCODRAFT_9846 [Conidiobolus coronatus NRRL 28638]
MRSIFRKGRKEREAAEVRSNQLKDKYSLFIELEPESKEDEIEAKKKQFKSNNQLIEKLEKTKEESLTSNLFKNTTANKLTSTSNSFNNLKSQFNQINDPFVNNTQTKPNSNGPLIKIKKIGKVSNSKKEETQPLSSLLAYASDSESDS